MSLQVKAVNLHLVTLSEKLRFLSDKNYDLFGANDSLGSPFYVLSI